MRCHQGEDPKLGKWMLGEFYKEKIKTLTQELKDKTEALERLSKWLGDLAHQSEQSCTGRFESLNDAFRADARNYRATKNQIDKILSKYPGRKERTKNES